MEHILLHIFVRGDPPLKNRPGDAEKSKSLKFQNQKLILKFRELPKGVEGVEGVEVTIWAANFDRYKYFLTIMSYKEKCMAS
jgi:hypothetical protein